MNYSLGGRQITFWILSDLSYFQTLFTTRIKRATRQSQKKSSFYYVVLSGLTRRKVCWILTVLLFMSWKKC